jgi:carboxyl-terminal processing protease
MAIALRRVSPPFSCRFFRTKFPMSYRSLPRPLACFFAVTLTVIGIALSTGSARAQADVGEIAQRVTNILSEEHYLQQPFDDEMSQRTLDAYLNYLDYSRVYFTAKDIERFRPQYEQSLDDDVMVRNLSAAYDIYDVYLQRVRSRIDKVKTLLNNHEFTFDSDSRVQVSRKDADWPADEAASDKLWIALIEGELLQETLRKESSDRAKAKADEKKIDAGEVPKTTDVPDGEANAAPAKPDTPPATGGRTEIQVPSEAGSEVVTTKPNTGSQAAKTPKEKIIDRYDRILKSVEGNDAEDQAVIFIKCIARAYDPHSEYFSQSQYDNFRISMEKRLEGIGAMLSLEEDGSAAIKGLVVGGPAFKQGDLQVMDRIVGVAQDEDEFVDTVGMDLNDIVDLIRGVKGSVVRLEVIPADASDPSAHATISIVRDKVDLKESLASAELIITKDNDGKVLKLGWINLSSFYSDMGNGTTSTTADVQRLVNRLTEEGVDGIVLDLRDNGGGSLEEAINLTGLFIPRGPVVQSKDWRGNRDAKYSRNRYALYDGPMIVLTNKASASASEILAAALQDYKRALIVGDKSTFGKGTVQQLRPVHNNRNLLSVLAPRDPGSGALKLTIQTFFRISGGTTQLKGVEPEIVLPSINDALEIGEGSLDNPLAYEVIEAQDYAVVHPDGLPVEGLQKGVDQRLAENVEYQYVREDIERAKQRIEENSVSLSRSERDAESKEMEKLRDARKQERIARFAEVREKERGLFTVYALTQDNVHDDRLTLKKDLTQEQISGMKEADVEHDPESKALEYPHLFNPMKREAIEIMKDFIAIEEGGSIGSDGVTSSTTAKPTASVTPPSPVKPN